MRKIAKLEQFAIQLSKGIQHAVVLCFFSSLSHADIAVVLNSANSGVTLNRTQVQSIFLGTQTKLPNGSSIKPYDQSPNQPITQKFYQLVANKNTVEMQTYWARLNFTGQGSTPVTLPDGNAVLQKVASNKNAIGYVDASMAGKASGVVTALVIPTS